MLFAIFRGAISLEQVVEDLFLRSLRVLKRPVPRSNDWFEDDANALVFGQHRGVSFVSICLYVSPNISDSRQVLKVRKMETVRSVAKKISRLEIKGARNVAIAAVETLQILAQETKAKSRQIFLQELSEAKEALFASRPTEPLLRNAVTFITNKVEGSEKKRVSDLAKVVASTSHEFLLDLEESRERVAEIGAKRIRDGMVIFTHCHSTTVTYTLRKAKQRGIAFEVFCTETRPAMQGRITAKELVDLGVKTTLIVDSAARSFMKKADIVIVGTDAITSEGNIVNKIGTATIALLAGEARVPFYVASELLKFDAATLLGGYEAIEERSRDELWKEAPEMLVVRNPAFEVIRRELIHGLICEEGVIPPSSVAEVARRKYPWLF
jgi:ribose 1,5-bisphosphate isomerase